MRSYVGYAYEAKEKVWNVLSQSWSAFPRSSLRRGTIFMGLMLVEEEDSEGTLINDRREA